jgi:cytochrome c-type biogenesis protein
MEALGATFLLGLASAASPCLLPLYPGFIAYLVGTDTERRSTAVAGMLGLAVLAGLLTTMLVLGIGVSLLALPLGDVLRWTVPLSTAVLVVLGLLLLAGRNPFERLATVSVPVVRHPLGQAYTYGLFVGPVALPCAGPFLVALLAISVGLADAAVRTGSFLVYGLGFGLPLVVLALIGTRATAIARLLARHHLVITRVAGALLIAAAVYQLVEGGYVPGIG